MRQRLRMISSILSRISALVLLVSGLALLFAPDVLLPAVAPGFPPAAVWLGQLLAAAWLGVAALNWLQRGARLGGIYGRPIVFTNLALYLISALSLLRALFGGTPPKQLWFVFLLTTVLAIVYGALLLRGPFDSTSHSTS